MLVVVVYSVLKVVITGQLGLENSTKSWQSESIVVSGNPELNYFPLMKVLLKHEVEYYLLYDFHGI